MLLVNYRETIRLSVRSCNLQSSAISSNLQKSKSSQFGKECIADEPVFRHHTSPIFFSRSTSTSVLGTNANEHEFQPWFKANAWVLGSDCVRILDDRRIDVRNIADFVVEGYDGRADVVELKRPGLRFWEADKDHDNYVPHPHLVAAIIQAQNYQFELEGEISNLKTRERFGIAIAKPSALLIHGRSYDWNDKQLEAQRLLNAGFTNLNVITYDQVLRRAEIMIGRNRIA